MTSPNPPFVVDQSPWLNKLWTAGFNTHGQLGQDPYAEYDREDAHGFDVNNVGAFVNCADEDVHVFYPCLTNTVYLAGDHIVVIGSENWIQDLEPGIAATLSEAFGDRDGMHGCIDTNGTLYTVITEAETSQVVNPKLSFLAAMPGSGRRLVPHPRHLTSGDDGISGIDHIAEAGNGKICVSYTRDASTTCYLVQFETLQAFHEWYEDPPSEQPEWQVSILGPVKQLLANATTFLCLRSDGVMMSWGDGSSKVLGRRIDQGRPPHRPGRITFLAAVTKIACGGLMSAALQVNGDLWFWGTGPPGEEKRMVGPLKHPRETIDPFDFVQFLRQSTRGEKIGKVIDFGVGDNHLAVLEENGLLWTIGDNGNGQCGLEDRGEDDGVDEPAWLEEWCDLIQITLDVKRVWCGPKCTFIRCDRK